MAEQGLEHRYDVRKVNDPDGKHADCRYFVLDPQHDPIAREALRDYAVHALSFGRVRLYHDLDRWLTTLAAPSSLDAAESGGEQDG